MTGYNRRMRSVILTVLLLAALHAAAQDTLRCGNEIVRIGMTMTEVEEYCGKPSATWVEVHDVRAGPRVVGETEIHFWQYDRAAGQRAAVLEFDRQELRSISYKSK